MATFSSSPNAYELSFAGVPLLLDFARTVRMAHPHAEQESDTCNIPPRKYQPLEEIISELDRLLPFEYLQDVDLPPHYQGRNLGAIARQTQIGPQPSSQLGINSWYYPSGATRWSMFRGLATSSAVKEILKVAEPFLLSSNPGETTSTLRTFNNRDQTASFTSTNTNVSRANASAKFVMLANPNSPDNPSFDASLYRLESNLFLLPPRPLAEHGGQFDGLYLITLVDERYWWQYSPLSLQINKDSRWDDLLDQLAVALGITLVSDDTLEVYGQPEPDSQLWTNFENVGVLLDAVAYNTGRTVVRLLDGSYILRTSQESQTIVQTNRNTAPKLVRTTGGDLFYSGNMMLKAGDLSSVRNAVVPDFVNVTFPIYIAGDDPVPHFSNPRYQNQRPSAWYEESFGEVYTVPVPITSGGALASGLLGTSGYTHSLHDTGKAFLSGEIASMAFNHSGLTALSMQLAGDYYDGQLAAALDESYPGTLKWTPEGIHDIVWTYSAKSRQTTTRVLKTQWNQIVREFQHTTPYLTGYSQIPKGIGGPSVAQSIRDSYSGVISTSIQADLSATATSLTIGQTDFLPTQNRWRGQIDNEVMLLEGTSGTTSVNIVYRGIDGTLPVTHDAGTQLKQIVPDTTYGVNLTTYEKGQFVYPAEWTSGGIQGVNVVPQVQSVKILDSVGTLLNGVRHYSGQINTYDASKSSPWNTNEYVWAVERNGSTVTQDGRYEGQLLGYSAAPTAPVYAIGDPSTGGTSSLEVTESDGSPDIFNVSQIVVDQATGLEISTGTSPSVTLGNRDSSLTQTGVVNLSDQTLGNGTKSFNKNVKLRGDFVTTGFGQLIWDTSSILTGTDSGPFALPSLSWNQGYGFNGAGESLWTSYLSNDGVTVVFALPFSSSYLGQYSCNGQLGITGTGLTSVDVVGGIVVGSGSGPISIAQGGTGASSFTLNGVLFGNGTSPLQVTAAGTIGQVLAAGSAPQFVNFASLFPTGTSGQVLTSDGAGGISFTTVASNPFADNAALVANSADATKLLILSAASITTLTTRTLTPQDADYTIAGLETTAPFTAVQTFSASPTAPFGVTPASLNERFGTDAANDTATGQANVAIGWHCLRALTLGNYNVAVGPNCLALVNSGAGNVGAGIGTLQNLATGDYNVAAGHQAMNLTTGVATANVAHGRNALNNVTGSYNVGTGDSCGPTITSGSYNCLLSASADVAASNTQYAVALGYNAVAASNEFALGPNINFQTWYGTSSTSTRQRADLTVSWVDSTDATRKAKLVCNVWDTAAREAWECESDGTGANLAFFGTGSYGAGRNVIFIANAAVAPSTNPTGGGILYASGGSLKFRGSGGTVTTLASAGKHCGNCGADFWRVSCVNEDWGAYLLECGWCGKTYRKGPKSFLHLLTPEQKEELLTDEF